jgi:hypothetical protein
VFLHPVTIVTIRDHRLILHGLDHTSNEPPFKKNRLLTRLNVEDDGDEEVESKRITAFDFDFLRYIYNSL